MRYKTSVLLLLLVVVVVVLLYHTQSLLQAVLNIASPTCRSSTTPIICLRSFRFLIALLRREARCQSRGTINMAAAMTTRMPPNRGPKSSDLADVADVAVALWRWLPSLENEEESNER